MNVGSWYHSQLVFYNRGTLSAERIELFQKAGLSLTNRKEDDWWNYYNLLVDYYKTTSDKTVTGEFIYKGIRLGNWVHRQQAHFRNNKLSKEKIDALNKINFPFTETTLDTQWIKNFNAVKYFFEKTSGNYIPYHTIVNNLDIYEWSKRQCSLYKINKLSSERIELLKSIGFPFKKQNTMSSSLAEAVLFYYIQKLFPNAKQRDTSNGFELDIYIEYNNIKIGCEFDGSFWHKGKFDKDLEKVKKCENEKIILFDIRFENCGSLQKETKYYHEYLLKEDYKFLYKSDEYQETIHQIISDICKELHVNFSVNASVDRDMEEITKFYAKSYNQKWLINYNLFKDFIIKNNVMPTKKNSDMSLYCWIRSQLTAYKENRLSTQQIKLLEDLIPYGFRWKDENYHNKPWDERYMLLVEYKKSYNHVNVVSGEIFNNFDLGRWVVKQRGRYKKGKLTQEQIEKLNAIGFLWESPNKRKKGAI